MDKELVAYFKTLSLRTLPDAVDALRQAIEHVQGTVAEPKDRKTAVLAAVSRMAYESETRRELWQALQPMAETIVETAVEVSNRDYILKQESAAASTEADASVERVWADLEPTVRVIEQMPTTVAAWVALVPKAMEHMAKFTDLPGTQKAYLVRAVFQRVRDESPSTKQREAVGKVLAILDPLVDMYAAISKRGYIDAAIIAVRSAPKVCGVCCG